MRTRRTVAIVPGAGTGTRLGRKTKKPFVLLCGTPLIVHTLRALAAADAIDGITVVVDASEVERFRKVAGRFRLKKIDCIVAGGATRLDSVRNGLMATGDDCEIVLVHDAARPFVSERVINESIRAARRFGAAVIAVPETDTVKEASGRLFVRSTLDRKILWRAQTPQTFRRRLLLRAFCEAGRKKKKRYLAATDDTSLVEALGRRVKIVCGEYANLKITTIDDLVWAETFARRYRGR